MSEITDKMEISKEKMKDIVLKDDASPYGGTAFNGETLYDFCESVDLLESDLGEINKALRECGICPINESDIG